jgi:Invasin, domain 3
VATFNNLMLDTSGTYTLAESDSGGLSGNNSNSFTVSPSSPDHLVFTVEPGNTTAGVAIDPAVKVQVLDQYNNLVSNDNSDQVTLSVATGPGGFTSGSPTTATVSGGIATFANLVLDTAGNYTLGESASGGLSGNDSTGFTAGTAAANHLTFTVQPGNTTAGMAIDPAVQAELFDKFNNLLTDDNSDVISMTIAGGPGGFDSSSTTMATVRGGIATFSNLIIDKAGTTYALSATGAGLQETSNSFSITPAPATQLAIVTQPTGNVLNGSPFEIQGTAEDPNGNVNTNYSGDVTIQLANDPNGNTTLGGTLTVAAINGVADFKNLTLNEVGQGFTLQATSTGLQSVVTNSFDIVDQLVATTQPQASSMAGGAFDVQVSAEDANGNVDSNFTGTIAIQLANDPNGNSALGGNLSIAAVKGVADFSNMTIDDAGQGFTLQASSSGQISTQTNSFDIFDQLVVTTQPPSTVSANDGFDVQISAEDANGNVDADFNGNVTLQLANDPDGNSTLGGKISVAAVHGIANFSNLTLNKVGQGFTLQAISAGQDSITSNPFEVIPGSVSLANSTLTVSPGSVQLDGKTTITLQAVDASGNTITTGGLTVAFMLGNGSAQGTISSVTDNNNGTYTATFTATADGSNTIEATIDGSSVVSTAPTINVIGNAYSLSRSVVTVSPGNVQSGSHSTIELQVKDAQGNPEEFGGLTVAFTLGSAGTGKGTIGPVTDNGNGTYTATFIGVISGSNTIKGTINGKNVTSTPPSIKVTAGTASPMQSTITLSSSTVKSGSGVTVTLQAKDANGNKETSGGLTVAFSLANADAGEGKFSSVKDNKNGTYTATFTGTVAGNNAIVATIGGATVTSSEPPITITVGPVNLASSFVIVTPGSIQSGSKTTVVLQARDAAGNDETKGGLTVAFLLGKAGGGRGTFGPVTDNHNGTYTVTFTGTTAGSNTIVATMDGLRVTSTAPAITVAPGPVSLAKSIVTVSPASMKVGSSITVTLQAKDVAGNKLTTGGLTLAFILGNSKGGQGTFSSVTDKGNGTYTATFTGTFAGNNTIRATIDEEMISSAPASIAITRA